MTSPTIRVVMIDDDEDDFKIVQDLLGHGSYSNYETIWIDNYSEGLRRLREQDGDVFLIDYRLGVKTGLELLKEAGGKNLQKPIIMLTGLDSPEVDLSAMELGATYYLQKGSLVVNHLLERTIRYTMKKAKDYEELRNLDRLKSEKAAAQAASETKSLFLASVSHEIRTPLAAILGFSELALTEPGNANGKTTEFLKIIARNAHHVLALVNNLLDLAKIEAGKYELAIASIDWRAMIREVFETLQLNASLKNDQLLFVNDPALPDSFETDAHCFRQILINLINNAIKFTENGRIKVCAVQSGDRFRLLVSDTGCGMSENEKRRLFRPFTQGAADLKRKLGGTGLGLHLSRKIAESLGGDLVLQESACDVGSTFALDLPAKWKQKPQAIHETTERKRKSLRGLSVLLAEDSEDLQALIKYYLKGTGANVVTAENGNIAVSKAKEGNFDVILMDIQMPGLDGLEATKALRAYGLRTPVIALSAHAMDSHCKKALESGFSDYITKPIQPKKLVEILTQYTM